MSLAGFYLPRHYFLRHHHVYPSPCFRRRLRPTIPFSTNLPLLPAPGPRYYFSSVLAPIVFCGSDKSCLCLLSLFLVVMCLHVECCYYLRLLYRHGRWPWRVCCGYLSLYGARKGIAVVMVYHLRAPPRFLLIPSWPFCIGEWRLGGRYFWLLGCESRWEWWNNCRSLVREMILHQKWSKGPEKVIGWRSQCPQTPFLGSGVF